MRCCPATDASITAWGAWDKRVSWCPSCQCHPDVFVALYFADMLNVEDANRGQISGSGAVLTARYLREAVSGPVADLVCQAIGSAVEGQASGWGAYYAAHRVLANFARDVLLPVTSRNHP